VAEVSAERPEQVVVLPIPASVEGTPKVVLYDATGKPLVRPVGFQHR
jgi:hypothetical protein